MRLRTEYTWSTLFISMNDDVSSGALGARKRWCKKVSATELYMSCVSSTPRRKLSGYKMATRKRACSTRPPQLCMCSSRRRVFSFSAVL